MPQIEIFYLNVPFYSNFDKHHHDSELSIFGIPSLSTRFIIKRNIISHFYQLDQSISVLRDVGWYFDLFFQIFCKQTM